MSFFPDDLLALLDEQVELLDQLIDFGEQQRQAIEASRISELIAILGQKQPHLDRLGLLRQQLHDQRTEIERDSFWPSSAVRQACQRLRDQASRGFEVLMELEQICELELTQSRNQIQQRLQNVESGRTAATAYESQANLVLPDRLDFSSVG